MKISHLISTFNRGAQLQRSLSRLALLPTKPDELVVVDDGSTGDNTSEVVHLAAGAMGIPLQYIYRTKTGYDISSIPRNIGLKRASHEWLLVSEPEVLFITDVVGQLKACALGKPDLVVSAGLVYFTNPETPVDDMIVSDPQRCIDERWDVKKFPMHKEDQFSPDGTRHTFYTQATVTRGEYLTATFCVLYKRDWLMEIGGWDEDFSLMNGGGGYAFEDSDILTRLRIKGYNQWINRDIQVIHQWHTRPPNPQADGWKRNEEIFQGKQLSINGIEDPSNPALIANQGREWGKHYG